MPFGLFEYFIHAIWFNERRSNFPKADGSLVSTPPFCGRSSDCQQNNGGTSVLPGAARKRLDNQSVQVHLCEHIHEIPGHMVLESGIITLPKHVSAVQEFLPPGNLKQLQQFLGMVNFYC